MQRDDAYVLKTRPTYGALVARCLGDVAVYEEGGNAEGVDCISPSLIRLEGLTLTSKAEGEAVKEKTSDRRSKWE